MSVIHYKSPQCTVTTVCGRRLQKVSTSFSVQPESVTCSRCAKHGDVIKARRPRQEIDVTDRSVVRLTVEIDAQSAWALAKFCKRSTFETFAQCAAGKDEAYQMRDALYLVWGALRSEGFCQL